MYPVKKLIAAEKCIDHDGQNLNQIFEENEDNNLNSYFQLHLSSPKVSFNAINTNPTRAKKKKNIFINSSPDANSKEESIKKSFCQWAVNYNVSQVTVNKLLTILKFETPLTFLLKDCRTLLKSRSSKVLNI